MVSCRFHTQLAPKCGHLPLADQTAIIINWANNAANRRQRSRAGVPECSLPLGSGRGECASGELSPSGQLIPPLHHSNLISLLGANAKQKLDCENWAPMYGKRQRWKQLTPVGLTIFRSIHAIDRDKPNTANSDITYSIVVSRLSPPPTGLPLGQLRRASIRAAPSARDASRKPAGGAFDLNDCNGDSLAG